MRPVNWSNPVNKNHHLNRGLIGWWLVAPHWQGGTIWRDLLGRSHGTLDGFTVASDWLGPTDRLGGWGALNFDETDNNVEIQGINPLIDVSNGTMIAWMKMRAHAGNGVVISCRRNSSNNIEIFWNNSPNTLDLKYRAGGTTTQIQSSTVSESDDTWHRVGITWNVAADEVKAYIDGKQDGSTVTGLGTWSGDFVISRIGESNGAAFFDGQIDDVRVLNRVWTPAQFHEDYRTSQQFYPGLLNRRGRRAVVAAAAGNAMPMAMDNYRRMRVA